MKTYDVVEGDSTKTLVLTIKEFATLDANWGCDIEVNELIDGSLLPEIDRAAIKKVDDSGFEIYLTPTETTALVAGKSYYWIIRLHNTTLTPPYHKTIINQLKVNHKG